MEHFKKHIKLIISCHRIFVIALRKRETPVTNVQTAER